jgi:predicted nuclease of restriction endonuclease-like (RecB) superfamily
MSEALTSYTGLLADIKHCIQTAQTRAVLAVNAELIRLYWEIGQMLEARQTLEGWGAGVIPRLAQDLHDELPEVKGFSECNLKRMLAFHRAYPGLIAKVPQAVAQIPAELIQAVPWAHHLLLMEKVKNLGTRQWDVKSWAPAIQEVS